MMKFFRKYNKQLLAFFMALLMIVFIAGSALEGLLRPDPNFEIGKSKLGSITAKDQRRATEETELLARMGQDWQRPLFSENEPLTPSDWILLSREAERMGVVPDKAVIETSPSFASQFQAIRTVAHHMKVKPDEVIAALARLQSIRQTALTMANAATPSEAEIIAAGRDSLERVKVRAVVLPAEAFVDSNATFTDAQIKEQFEKYRERERGQGLEFGYYRQPAIKVQYIKIDRDAIAGQIKIANEERRAKAYYEQHREKDPIFRRKSEDMRVYDVEIGPPAPTPTLYVDWEQAAETAKTELRKEMASENVQRIVDWLIPTMTEAWMGLTPAETGYKTAPTDVAQADYYAKLVERMPPGLRFPDTVTIHTTEFFTQADATKVPELGPLSVRSGQSLMARSFGSVVFNNEKIVEKIPDNERSNSSDYLALHQTGTIPLSDGKSGNVYVFRVVDFRPGGPAESVDQVREEVIADLRLMQGFEKAKVRAESLRSCCLANDPLKDAYEADPELAAFRESGEGTKTGYFEPAPFSRIGQAPAWKGRPADGAFVGGGLGKLSNKAIDSIFAMGQGGDKFAVLELPERGAVMTVEWVENVAAQEEEFASQRNIIVSQLSDSRFRDFVNDWFDPEKIRARNGFDLIRQR